MADRQRGERLLALLDSVDESSGFCCQGRRDPVLPGLHVQGVGEVGLPIRATEAKALVARATRAPYGRGEETIVDTSVRKVWQLDPSQFSTRNKRWTDFLDELVDSVRQEFAISRPVQCELYKLLIYDRGSFFVPHRDTEKLDGMFATLVVVLPSRHKGGTLIVQHDGSTEEVDFADPSGQSSIQYAAFYADCKHEIRPVTSGYRVCLVYNLAVAKRKRQPSAPRDTARTEQSAELLREVFADGALDKLAVPLEHEYTPAGLSRDGMKGGDRSRVDILVGAAERLGFDVHLAQIDFYQSGLADCDLLGGSRRWGRKWKARLENAEMGEVYDETLSLKGWGDPSGRKRPFGDVPLERREILLGAELESLPFRQAVTEATGNEGVTVERWYSQASVVVWPPDRYYRIIASAGPEAAIPLLQESLAKARTKPRKAECTAFAEAMIDRWDPHGPFRSRADSRSGDMLKLLVRLGDQGLLERFVGEVLARDCDGSEGPVLRKAADKFGWRALRDPVRQFLAGPTADPFDQGSGAAASIVESLSRGGGPMTPERSETCRTLVARLLDRIVACDADRNAYGPKHDERSRIVESYCRSCAAVAQPSLLRDFLEHAFDREEQYDLHGVLIPAVQALGREAHTKDLRPLRDRCIEELKRRTKASPTEPRNWARRAEISCSCEACGELRRFLADPAEQVHRFKLTKYEREHLRQEIDRHECDLDLTTDESGRPHTLVCTKNQASYERQTVEFARDQQLLAELRRPR